MSGRTPIKPSWPKASLDNMEDYSASLKHILEALSLQQTLSCNDQHCSDPAHSQQRDSNMLDILLAIVETSHTTLPLSGGTKVGGKTKTGCNTITGWPEEVGPFRQESMYWHRVWLSEGRPNHGCYMIQW